MKKILLFCLVLCGLCTFTANAEEAAKPTFAVTTTAFLDQMMIPVLYTCDGKNISPQLEWTEIPAKTTSFAIVMSDADVKEGKFYHWVLYNIPKNVTSLDEGITKLPAGVLTGLNSFQKQQYAGPCPPTGTAHNYVFTIYALDSAINLPAGADGKTLLNAMQKHIVGKTSLTGVYTRWPPA